MYMLDILNITSLISIKDYKPMENYYENSGNKRVKTYVQKKEIETKVFSRTKTSDESSLVLWNVSFGRNFPRFAILENPTHRRFLLQVRFCSFLSLIGG